MRARVCMEMAHLLSTWNDFCSYFKHWHTRKYSYEDTVEQPIPEMTFEEGTNITITCNLKTSATNPYVYWYSQPPGQPPQYVVYRITAGMVKRNPDFSDRFSLTFDKTAKTTELAISNAFNTDSAVYFCAMSLTLAQTDSRARQKPSLSVPARAHEKAI
ncbi:hypothetical protein chiPu_0019055 [Chiloscyllium punctatum]|uniref:Ig-like domain-containing protein n=1 Tax=Chiloscyllium punctatum TaxID=137246 RepID=A0A401RQQ6_CHIPU|nr:hypothetical protein [Chiloscyllium punctatum]